MPTCQCYDIVEGPSDGQVKQGNTVWFRIRNGRRVIACKIYEVFRHGPIIGRDPDTGQWLSVWYRKLKGGHMIVYPQLLQSGAV